MAAGVRLISPGADAAIRVLERLRHQHSGESKGLEGWQKFVVRRRYEADPGATIVFIISRGAAKTTLSGGMGVIDLWQTPAANVYTAATSLTQAEELFRHAAYFAAQGKDLTVRPSTRVIRAADGGFLRVLAADLTGRRTGAAQGYAPTYVALDELQAWRAMSMFVDLQTSLFKRGGQMLITGLPADRGHPLSALREQAMAGRVESGLLCTDDGYSYPHPDGRMTVACADGIVWIEWGLGIDEDWQDPAVAKLANPASWITRAMLAQGLSAPGVPEWALRTMRCGQWLDIGATDWLPPAVLAELWRGDPILCDLPPVPADEPEAAANAALAWARAIAERHPTGDAYAAVDMGRYRDRTAVGVVANGTLHMAVMGDGENPTPYELVRIILVAIAAAFGVDSPGQARHIETTARLRGVAWDPKYLDESAAILVEAGLPMIQVPQSQDRQVTQSRALRDALVTGALRSDGNPDAAEHAGNVKVVRVGAGVAWKIGRGDGPIDAMSAAAMAWDIAQRQPEVVEEPWIL